jgi:DNA-binding NarL/FixJ family response regulator
MLTLSLAQPIKETSMEPLNLLIVAIKIEWQHLVAESLEKAGYNYQIKYVPTKQSALQACHEAKFDMVISNCTLPDGQVADLVSVLGKLVPCLVMAEGQCPVTSEHALSLLASDFYITSTEQTSWLVAMENAISKWKANAQINLDKHLQDSSNLHKRILARCEEELSSPALTNEQAEHSISNVFNLLLEVLELSRIYLCVKKPLPDGEQIIVQKNEVSAPGINQRSRTLNEIPYFSRWNSLFKSKQPVLGLSSSLPAKEQQWLNQRDAESLLAVPIHNNGNWNGFIGLEDVLNPRQWSAAEIGLMESVADLIEKKHFLNASFRHELQSFSSQV